MNNYWDLHLHTPYSSLYNRYQGENDSLRYTSFINRINELDVSVLGLTDYFSIGGYLALKKRRQELPGVGLLLPNLELRLISDKGNLLNGHLIFDPAYDFLVETELLPQLSCHFKGKEYFCHTEDLTALGCLLGSPSETPEAVLKSGLANFKTSLSLFLNVLQQKKFADRYIFGFQYNTRHETFSSLTLRQDLLEAMRKTDVVFTVNKEDTAFFLYTPDEEMKTFLGLPKTPLFGTDAHGEQEIYQSPYNIDTSLTFKGLKEATKNSREKIKLC